MNFSGKRAVVTGAASGPGRAIASKLAARVLIGDANETGRRLAEAGATAKMVMAVPGHTTLAEAERYTEEADQADLAEDAVIRLEGHKANRLSRTKSTRLGKAAKSKGKSK